MHVCWYRSRTSVQFVMRSSSRICCLRSEFTAISRWHTRHGMFWLGFVSRVCVVFLCVRVIVGCVGVIVRVIVCGVGLALCARGVLTLGVRTNGVTISIGDGSLYVSTSTSYAFSALIVTVCKFPLRWLATNFFKSPILVCSQLA